MSARAAELRRLFDASFAAAPEIERPLVSLLALDVGSLRVAVRLTACSGLHHDVRIVPAPSERPTLRGLVGLRGAVLPVHDLAMLLGEARAADPRWILVARGATPLALAFDRFAGHLRVLAESVVKPDAELGDSHRVLRGSITIVDDDHPTGLHRPLVDLDAVGVALATP